MARMLMKVRTLLQQPLSLLFSWRSDMHNSKRGRGDGPVQTIFRCHHKEEEEYMILEKGGVNPHPQKIKNDGETIDYCIGGEIWGQMVHSYIFTSLLFITVNLFNTNTYYYKTISTILLNT